MKEIIEELIARVISGPFHFRLIVQPTMAICLGIRDGLVDAKAGAPPFVWGLPFHAGGRKPCLRSALRRLQVPILVATLADAIVQYLMFQHVRPVTALIVGTLLMGLPYSAARGLSNRIRSRGNASRHRFDHSVRNRV